jgi:hypothetical protein
MSCNQTEKISLLIDGELPAAERRVVERHLVECTECNQVREDFLNLRSQIAAYSPVLEPSAADLALARIVSKQAASITTEPAMAQAWRNPFSGLLGSAGFNPRLAAVVALLVVALTIGGITFLRFRSQRDLVSAGAVPMEKQGVSSAGSDERSNTAVEPTAQLKSNSAKGGPNEGRRTRQLNKRGLKPRERSTPTWQPRPQSAVPPTYALVDENLMAPSTAPGRHVEAEMLTARHLEQSELLLRAFRNIRAVKSGSTPEIAYERRRAQQLLYQNIRLRRDADDAGDVQVASLLNALEPILLDIANLRDRPDNDEVRAIRERVERKNLVALLQINSTAVARAYE